MPSSDPRLPEYWRIADALRDRIEGGELPPGWLVPSVVALAAEHGVARATARRAVAELEAAGLVRVDPRRGTFVRELSAPHQVVLVEGEVTARLPTAAEARRHGLPGGMYVLQIARPGRRPVVLPADRVVLKISSGPHQE